MNAFNSILIDAHNRNYYHAGDERMTTYCVSRTRHLCLFEGDTAYAVFPNLIGQPLKHAATTRAEAQTVIDTALWAGSPFVSLVYGEGAQAVVETWVAV